MRVKDKYDLNISEDMALNDFDIASLKDIQISYGEVIFTHTIDYATDYLCEVIANRYNISEDQAYELIQKAEEEE